MGDWLLNLPLSWMALLVFVAIYLVAATVYFTVIGLAADERRARAFKALSPGMLPPLGIIFGLLVGFVAVQVWNDFDRAKVAVMTEASALRGVVLLTESVPEEQRGTLRRLVNRHIDEAVTQEWGSMAKRRLTMATLPTHLIDALKVTLALQPADETQRIAQREIINDLHRALEARRQRIVVSQSSVSVVKWAAILLQGLCALVAIAMVHSDNKLTCAIALSIFATGIAVSVLLMPRIAARSRAKSRSARISCSRSSRVNVRPGSPRPEEGRRPVSKGAPSPGVNHSLTRQRPLRAAYGKLQTTLKQRHLRGRARMPRAPFE